MTDIIDRAKKLMEHDPYHALDRQCALARLVPEFINELNIARADIERLEEMLVSLPTRFREDDG